MNKPGDQCGPFRHDWHHETLDAGTEKHGRFGDVALFRPVKTCCRCGKVKTCRDVICNGQVVD